MAPLSSSLALDFLRRLLCAHTSTAIARRRQTGDAKAAVRVEEKGVEARKSPCIVARLMGLDAMPVQDQQQPLQRSRSASSAEGCCFEEDDAPAPQPRVIRTVSASASFREKPAYLRRENDEFLILSFSPEEDDHDDGKTLRSDGKTLRSDGDENAGRRGRKRGDGARKQRRRPRRPAECGLQNSSPVSVLEARDGQESSSTTSSSLEEADSPCSGEIQPAPRQQQGSRRKLLQPESDNLGDNLTTTATSISCGRLSRFADRQKGNRRAVNQDNESIIFPDVATVWRPVCRLLQEDLSGCVTWEGMGDATNIAAGVESGILDQLIREATDELVQLM